MIKRLFSLTSFCFLAACANSGTMGTFDTHQGGIEQQLLGSILGGVSGSNKEPIDYSPRPGLVIPPSGDLPQPQEQMAAAQNPEWPVDPSSLQGQGAEQEKGIDGYDSKNAKLNNSELSLRLAQSHRKTALAEDPTRKGYYTDGGSVRYSAAENKRLDQKNPKINTKFDPNTIPERRFLSDPPTELRQPAQSAQYVKPEVEQEPEVKKKNGYNPTR